MKKLLLILMLLPMLSNGDVDTLRANAQGAVTNWTPNSGTAVDAVQDDDELDIEINEASGDDGTENHEFLCEATVATGTIDSVEVEWKDGGIIESSIAVNIFLGSDTTIGTTRTGTGTFKEKLARPGGGSWSVADIDTLEFVVDGLGGLTFGEQSGIDYVHVFVYYSAAVADSTHTFYDGGIDPSIHARYLDVTMYATDDSAFEFSGWQDESTVRFSLGTSRTSEFIKVSNNEWIWKQTLASKPSTGTARVWADTIPVTLDSVELITGSDFITAGAGNFQVYAYHQGSPQGSQLQRNYTKADNDSVEYNNGKLFVIRVPYAIDDNGDTVEFAGDSLNYDTTRVTYSATDGAVIIALDTNRINNAVYPIDVYTHFWTSTRGYLVYAALAEDGAQAEQFTFNGPTGSRITGYSVWMINRNGVSDSVAFYMGLFSDCATPTDPDTIIELVPVSMQMDRDTAMNVHIASQSFPELTNGVQYWIMVERVRGVGSLVGNDPDMYQDNHPDPITPLPDSVNWVSWFGTDAGLGPPDSTAVWCIGFTEGKFGWYSFSYQEPGKTLTVQAGATLEAGATLK